MNDSVKPPALTRIVEIANELETGNPKARNLIKDLFAAFSEVMAHFEAPQPISTIGEGLGAVCLVFSPEQGGWNIGQFRNGRWTDVNDAARPLIPTHWLRLPDAPGPVSLTAGDGQAASSREEDGVSLMITRAQKAMLRQQGFDEETIRSMKPEVAHRHLRRTA
jgi:hypothetical protein